MDIEAADCVAYARAGGWLRFTKALTLCAERGITMKLSPVEGHPDWVVVELCNPPTTPQEHSCWFSRPCHIGAAVADTLTYLRLGHPPSIFDKEQP